MNQFQNKKILFTAFSVSPTSEELALVDYLRNQGATDITALYWGGDEIASQIPTSVQTIVFQQLFHEERNAAVHLLRNVQQMRSSVFGPLRRLPLFKEHPH